MITFHEWLGKKKIAPQIAGKGVFAPMAQSSSQAAHQALGSKDVLGIQKYLSPKQLKKVRKATGLI